MQPIPGPRPEADRFAAGGIPHRALRAGGNEAVWICRSLRHARRPCTGRAMSLFHDTVDFAEISAEVEAAAAWLESIGVRYAPSRLGKYRKCLRRLRFAAGRGPQALRQAWSDTRIARMGVDIEEWTRIFRAFKDTTDPAIVDRLRVFIGGPESSDEEKIGAPSNVARNVGFELGTAADLRLGGIDPDLAGLADLRCVVQDRDVFIECKRPWSENSVDDNIQDAMHQLKKRYAVAREPDRARGVVALSVSRVLNPDGKRRNVQSLDDLDRMLEEAAEVFVYDFEARWQRPDDPRTIGAIVALALPVYVEEISQFIAARNFALATPRHGPSPDNDLLREIIHRVSAGRYALRRGNPNL